MPTEIPSDIPTDVPIDPFPSPTMFPVSAKNVVVFVQRDLCLCLVLLIIV